MIRKTSVACLLATLCISAPLWAQVPTVSDNYLVDTAFPGDQVCFDIDFTNVGVSEGYGPYVRLTLPPEISFDSATFLGTGLTVTSTGVFPVGGTLTDPLSGDVVSGPVGGSLLIIKYPIGSVVTGGPTLTMQICADIDDTTAVGTMLDVIAQPVYQFGDTATGVNGRIEGVAQTETVTLVLIDVTKENDAPESENPPSAGGHYVKTYTINVDVAPNNSVFDIVVDDVLPAGLQYVALGAINGGINATAAIEPSTLTPGGTLRITFDRIDGTTSSSDASFTYTAYISDILDETNCNTSLLTNTLSFDYEFPDNTPLATINDTSNVTAKHVVIRKSVSNSNVNPGDTVTFTNSFAVTDFGNADSVIITDVLDDGFTFGSHLTLDIGGGNVAVVPGVVVNGAGVTTLTYDVTAVTGTLPAGTTGTITYTADIDQDYTNTGDPLLAADTLNTNVTLAYDLVEGASGCSDDSSAGVTIDTVAISKSIVNPQSEYKPGETVIFRLSLTVPSGDTSAIVFEDFFPLPVFDVTLIDTTFGNDITYAPGDTAGLVPTSISTNAATNSLRIEWPDVDNDPTSSETIAVDVALTIVDEPFADDIFLTNLFQAATENTPGSQAIGTSPVSLRVRAPFLELTKGISASDNPTADATIAPVASPIDGNISASDAGDTITYVITVQNTGGAPAYDVVITDPAVAELTGVTLVSVENSKGTTLSTTGSIDSGLTLDDPIPRSADFSLEATLAAALFTDLNMDGNPDAGDTIEYTARILNNDGAVTNALFNITVPTNTTYVGGSLSTDRGAANDAGDPSLTVNLGAMANGDTATVTFRVTIDGGVLAGTAIDAQGITNSDQTEAEATDFNDLSADGNQITSFATDAVLGAQPGAPAVEDDTVLVTVQYTLDSLVEPAQIITNTANATFAAGSGSTSFPAVTDEATVTIDSPSVAKTVTAIAPGYAGNLTQVHIGELITYTIVITLPEGTTTNVTLSDLLDNGLAFTDVVSITPSSGDVSTDAAGGFAGVLAAANITNSGAGSHQLDRSLSLDFDNITNSNTDDATAETITVVTRARVLNWTNNNRGNTRNNSADWDWDNPNEAGQLNAGDSAPNVTIIEPDLSVSKTITPDTGDAGDTVTITLDIAHTGSSNADAKDITLADVLPTGMTFLGGLASGGSVAPTTGPVEAGGTVSATWNDFPQGSTGQISFTATLDSDVNPQEVISNSADLEWESLQTSDEGALPSPPANTLGVERTGNIADTGTTANTYSTTNNDTFTVDAGSISKSVESISPGGASPNATVGDTVVWRVTVTLPEGETNNLVVSDVLPPGFSFQDATLDTTGFNGTVSIDGSPGGDGDVTNGETVTVNMTATTTVTPDGSAVNNSFAILVESLVEDVAANAATVSVQNKTNTATITYTGSSGTIQDTASLNFAEPVLTIAKTMSKTSNLQGGETVTVTLTVSNTGTAPAYDIAVTDTLNDDGALFDTSSASEVTTPAGYTYVPGDPTVGWTANAATALAAGAMATFEFSVNIADTVITGSNFSNTAGVTGDTQDGNIAPDPERTTSDTGSVNLTTQAPTGNKTLSATSESWTSDTAPIEAAVGEVLTFQLAYTLPEGTTQADGVILVDSFPAGYQYLTGTAAVSATRDTTVTGSSFSLTEWGSGDATTAGATLRRADTVCSGDTSGGDGFTTTQWNGFAEDTFGGLGTHAVSCGVPADIIISEYVAGSGSNQALEFFNGTGGLIDLGAGNYIVEIYADGSLTATQTISLTGTVGDGNTYVLGNSAAAAGITGVSDQTEAGAWFDGNDAIVLKSGGAGGTILDVIGQIAALDEIPDVPVPIEPTVNGTDLEFNLGDLVNNDNDGTGNTEQIIVTYNMLTLNTSDNNRTDAKTNTGSFNYLNRDGAGQSITDNVDWTIAEPNLAQTKTADMTTVEGGDTITFTAVLTNTSGTNVTRAWEPEIEDILPSEYSSIMLVSATLSRGAVDLSAGVSIMGNTITLDMSSEVAANRYLDPSETLTLVYSAVIDPSISFEEQVTNTATGTATSLPGTNGTDDATPGAAASTTGERTGSGAGENDFSVTAMETVTAGKPTITKSGDANLQIGETTTMTIQVDVPVGTTNTFVITDNLPTGLTYTGAAITINTPMSNFSASLSPSTTPGAGTDPLVFNFGTITNSAASAQSITISYLVEVDNILANQNTTTLTNTATLSYQNATMPLPSDTATITVVEANLEVSKSITSGAVNSDAGDTIEYTVTVQNTAGVATAYRVDITDVLPANLLGGAPTFNVTSVDDDGGQVVENGGGAVTAGDAVIATTTNTDDTLGWPLLDIPAGATLTIVYEAVLANATVAGEMLTNTLTVTYDSLEAGGGRDAADSTDDDDANLDNYGETTTATLTVDASIAISKSLNAAHATNDFTIGDLITFDIRVDVIEGVKGSVVVTDVLPAGLDFEGPVNVIANPNISHSFAAAVEAPAGTITMTMGNVTNIPDGNTTNDFFILEVSARVEDVMGNADGAMLTNTTSLTADVGSAGPDTQEIDIVEPNLLVTKAVDKAAPSVGDTVTFTVTVTHDTSTADAFNVVLDDVIPSGLTYVPGSHSGDGAVDESDPTHPEFDLGSITLAEVSKSFTFQCSVDLDATVGVTITNSIDLNFDGQSGTPTVQRTYTDSDDVGLVPAVPAVIDAVKTVAITMDAGSPGVVDPGDELTYTITLTNTAAAVTNALFTDSIPANTTYVAASLATDKGVTDDSGDPLSVAIGPMATSEVVTITFSVTVDGGTPGGTIISNQGFVDSNESVPEPTDEDGVDGNGDQPTDIPVGDPPALVNALYVQKLVAWLDDADMSSDITAGDEMRYILILENRGDEALTGVTLSDTLPMGLTYVGATATSDSGTLTVIGSAVSLTGASIGIGGVITAEFNVTIDAFAPMTMTYINQAATDSDQTDPGQSDSNGDPGDGDQPTTFSAVNGIAGSPSLDVEKRWLQATDADGDGLVDPGDTLLYTITVQNTGSADATNVRLADPTPTDTTFLAGSASTSNGAVVSTDPLDVNIGDIPPGGLVTIRFRVTVDGGTPDGTIIPNQATVTADGGITEPSDDNGSDSDGKNPVLTPVDTGGGAGSPTGLIKSLFATSEGDSSSDEVFIGEAITFRLNVSMPAGLTREATLTDTLPAGLTYIPGTAQLARFFDTGLVSSTDPGGVDSAASGVFVSLAEGSDIAVSGQTLTLFLGDVINSDSDVNTETYTLEIQVVVANSAGNQAATVLTNQGAFSWLNNLNQPQSLTPATSAVTVLEANPTITKSADPPLILTAGGDVIFTLTITNADSGFTGHGFDLNITDTLPAAFDSMTVDSIVPAGGVAGVTDNSAGTTIDVDVNVFPPDGTLTITVTGTASGPVTTGTLTNTATTTWTSIPGLQGTATPGNPGDADGERTGPGVAPNDYTTSDTADVEVGTPGFTKTILTPQARYAVGDTVSYQLEVSLPPNAALDNVVVADVLDEGLTYDTASLMINYPAGVSSSSNPTEFARTDDDPMAGQETLTLNLGTLTNTNGSTQTVGFTYTGLVDNILGNQDNATLNNNATLDFDDPGGGAAIQETDSASVTVGEPHLALAKTITSSTVGLDAGDTVDFQIVVSNDGTTTAYEVVLSDVLPTGLENTTSLSVDSTSGGAATPGFTNNGSDWNTTSFDIPVGGSVTISFTASLANTVIPGEQIQNSTQATFTSRDGTDANERNGDDAASDQDDNTDLDNYNTQDSAPVITVDDPVAIDKTFTPDPANTTYTIGESFLYRVQIGLIEGTVDNMVVTDILPGDVRFVSASTGVGNMGMTLQFNNAPVEAGQELTFTYGTISNPADGNTANDFITIDITVIVEDVVGNVDGAVLGNNASVAYDAAGGTQTVNFDDDIGTPGVQPLDLTIVEPDVAITKTVDNPIVPPGDTVTFTLLLDHLVSSTADAYDLAVIDTLPAGLTYVPGSANIAPAISGQQLTFTVAALTLIDDQATITYQATVDPDVVIGDPLTNDADLTYTSQPGANADERTYTDTDNDTVTPGTLTFIEAVKTVSISNDLGTLGEVNPGDRLAYTIVLTNSGATAENVVFSDPVPLNTTYFTGSLSSSAGSVDDSSDPLIVDVGTMLDTDTVTITFEVTVDGGTPDGTIISNQGQVDSDQTVPEPTDEDGIDGNGDQPTDIPVGTPPALNEALYVQKVVNWLIDADASMDVTAGDTMRYTLLFTNIGNGDLTGVSLTDTIPAGLTAVAASETIAAGNTIMVVGDTVTVAVPDLPVGNTITASFEVTIDGFVPTSQTYINQGIVDSDQTDPDLTDSNGDPNDGSQPTTFTAVNGISGTPILDVEKRWQQVVDLDSDGLIDPNDTIAYTITLVNTGAAVADNVVLNDTIPANTTIVTSSVNTSQGIVITEDPVSVNISDMDPGDLVTVTFRVTVNGGTPDGTIIPNQATASGDNFSDEPSDDNGEDGDGKNPTLTPVDTDGTNGGSPSALTKSITGTSESDSSGTEVLIGEIITYQLRFDVPAGITSEVTLADTLPIGMTYLAGSALLQRVFDTGLTASQNPGAVNSAATGVDVPLTDASDIIIDGQDLAVLLGTIINSDNDGDSERYILTYRVLVTNNAGNQAGTDLVNNGTLSYLNGLSQLVNLTPSTTTVTVTEPTLSISLSALPTAILTSGGDVVYTLTVRNETGANDATAFDVNITDLLPGDWTGLTVDSIVPMAGATGITDNTVGTSLDIQVVQMDPGAEIVITFTGTAPGVLAEGTLPTTADVTWTSLPGVNGTGAQVPDSSGGSEGERNADGGINDYAASDSTNVVVGNVNMVKSIDNQQTRYAIGDVVAYRIVITLPSTGTKAATIFNDILDEGLTYNTGSLNIATDMGLTSSLNPSEFSVTDNSPSAGEETLNLDFGILDNSTGAPVSLTLTYTATVDNILINQNNETRDNTVTLDFDDPGGSGPVQLTDMETILIGEPHLTLAHTITSNTAGLEAGDTVDFQVVITNDGNTTAFETAPANVLPAGLENVTGLMVTAVTGGAATPGLTNNGSGWSSDPFDLPPGAGVTITFSADLGLGVIPGQTIQNQITATFTSVDGSDAGERDGSDPGSNQDDDNDRNNYNTSDNAPSFIVADSIALDKAFYPNAANSTYTIGEAATYRLTIALIEGTIDDLVLTDVLPDGVTFVSASVGNGNMGITTAYSGDPTEAGQTLTFDFGQMINPANAEAGDDFITVDITVTVDNISANQNGTLLGNHAAVTFTGPGGTETRNFDADAMIPGIQPLDLDVVIPIISVTKVPDITDPEPGEEVTFTLTIGHDGTSTADAYDIVIIDTIPPELAYVVGSADAPVNINGERLIFTISSLALADAPVVITYRAAVNTDAPLGIATTNTVGTTWTTLPDAEDGERTGVDGAGGLNDLETLADASVTPSLAALDATKTDALTDDADGNSLVSPGDTLTYTVSLTNTGNVAVSGLIFTDDLETNLALVAGSVMPGQGTVTTGNTPGDTSIEVNLGSLAGGDSTTITFQARVADPFPADTNAVVNQGLVVSNELPDVPTDDPDTPAEDDPTVVPVSAAPDLSVLKTDALFFDADSTGDASAGDTLQYTLTITNNGNQNAEDVVLTDVTEPNLTLVAGSITTTQGTVDLGNNPADLSVAVDLGTLTGNGGSAEVTFQVTIADPLPDGVTQVANQAVVSSIDQPPVPSDDPDVPGDEDPTVTPVTRAPLLVASKADALAVDADMNTLPSPGDTLTYTVTISNLGNATATGVSFSDIPDSNTTLVSSSVTTSQGVVNSGNGGTPPVMVDLGDLAPNHSATITFQVTINNPLPAGITQVANQGIVSSDDQPDLPTDDPDVPGEDDPTETPLSADPRLEVSKTDTLFIDEDLNGLVGPGDTLLYLITITNSGNTAATGVTLSDTPDTNTLLVPGSVQTSQGLVTGTAPIAVSLGSIDAGASATVSFAATVIDSLPDGVTTVANQAVVGSNELPDEPSDDPDTPADDDPTETPVTAEPILRASKTDLLSVDADGNGYASPGDTLSYTVTITNSGNAAASVSFTDTPDSNTTLVPGSIATSQGVVTGEIDVDLGTLAAGISATITFDVTVNNPLPMGVTRVANQGTVNSPDLPPVLTDDPDEPGDEDPTETPVGSEPELTASKTDSLVLDNNGDGEAGPGDVLRYTITLTNSGNGAATGVRFTDTPDSNTILVPGSVTSTHGSIVEGPPIEVDLDTIVGGGAATITFEVTLAEPFPAGVSEVSNQGNLESNELPDVPTDDPDEPGDDDPTVTPVPGKPQLAVLKTDALTLDADMSGNASAGDTLTYTITVSNTGNQGTPVTLSDVPDAFTTLIIGSVSTDLGTVDSGNNGGDSHVAVSMADLAAGTTATITFQVTINDPLPADLTKLANQAVAQSPALPPVPSDDPDEPGPDDPTETPLGGNPILLVTKIDSLTDTNGNGYADASETITYTVTITNSGNGDATGVTFSDHPDNHTALTPGSVTSSQGSILTGNAGVPPVWVDLGTLAAGASATISFAVTIDNPLAEGVTEVANQAVVSSNELPDQPSDDPDTPESNDPTETPLGDAPDLSVTKVDYLVGDNDNSGGPSAGDTLAYLVTITNHGGTATDVVFSDSPDSNTTLVPGSITTTNGNVTSGNDGNPPIQVALGDLELGEVAQIGFRVTIDNPLPASIDRVINQGIVSTPDQPDVPSDDPDIPGDDDPTETPVTATPSLSAAKTDVLVTDLDGNGLAGPGDTLLYLVTIHNNGNADATGVVFTDTPDDNTFLVPDSVMTDQGVVTSGNAGLPPVSVTLGTIGAGKTATITFRVTIIDPLPFGLVDVANQGLVSSNELPVEQTDDPDAPGDEDPTVTPVNDDPILKATKTDILVIDADNNGVASGGDTLAYLVTVANVGNAAATEVTFLDFPDANTSLVPNSVQTTVGSVTAGNDGIAPVSIAIGTLPAKGVARIVFRVTIDTPVPDGLIQLVNQGLVTSTEYPGVLTDDPEVLGEQDPTVTPLGPNPRVIASKTDMLYLDNDSSGGPSAGDELAYQIIIRNQGDASAESVTFSDTPDPNTTLVPGSVQITTGTITSGNAGAPPVTADIGTIPSGGTVVLSYRVTVNDPLPMGVTKVVNQGLVEGDNIPETPTDDPDIPGPDDPTEVELEGEPVLNAFKDDTLFTDANGDGVVSPGDTVLYQIQILNTGNVKATGVILEDTPDANTTLINGSIQTSQGAILDGNDGTLPIRVALGEIDPAGSALVTFRVTIANPLPITVTEVVNQAVISSNETPDVPSTDPDGPQFSPTPTLVSQADLTVTKTPSVTNVVAGTTFDYTMVVTNLGPNGAGDVILTDPLPAQLDFVSATPDQGSCSYNPIDRVVTCNLGALGVDATAEVVLTVFVMEEGLIENSASVTAPQIDPEGGNNDDAASVTAVAGIDLELVKTVDNPIPDWGDTIIFTLSLTNQGPDIATGVTVNDVLPSEFILLSTNASSGSFDESSGNWSLASVGVFSTETLDLEVRVQGLGTLTNDAEVTTSDQSDTDSTPGNSDPNEDDQDEATVTVDTLVDLTITKTLEPRFPMAGETAVYTLVVENLGPSPATGVVAADNLPDGMVHVENHTTAGAYDPLSGNWSIGDLAVGAEVTLELTVVVSPDLAGEIITNTATVSANEPEADTDNNSDSVSTQIVIPVPILGPWGLAGLMLTLMAAAIYQGRRRHTP